MPAGVPDIGLTDVEKIWIKEHPVIRAGHDVTYAPYSLQDRGGMIVGIDPDFLELVAQRTGLKFHNETRASWPVMLEAFQAREVDVLPSVDTSPERDAYMAYSTAYTLAPNVIITRNDAPYLLDLRDLAGRAVGVPRGYAGLIKDLKKHAPGHQAVEYDNTLECYRAVARGEVFASVGDVANAAYLIKSNHLSNLRLGGVISESSEIYFGIRKDWPELVSIFDKAIASFTPLERKRINDRWIALDYEESHWWARAFKIAAGIAVVAVLIFLLVFLHNRRLERELTERRRIQRELEEAHMQLARVSEEKSELLRMVAHDLRSPLTGVILGTDLLKADGGRDPQIFHDTLDQMRSTAQQMIRLTNDLVDVNALEAGRRVYQWGEVDLSALLHETVTALSERAARKLIRLRLLAEEPEMLVHSDASALRQVADNLISNALKYSPAHTEVVIELRRNGTGYHLYVRDQGPGISGEDRQKLFQKYARGHAMPTGGEKSTGLGLWIVQRVVVGLHGEVQCVSEAGRGATFIVSLPRRPAGV